MTLLAVANLVYSIGDRRLLDGVNLTLQDGEHVGLVGRNGCGKSTLLKMIAGLGGLKPDSGQVQIARTATVGYLTQDPDLDPARTLRQEAETAFARLHELHQNLEQLAHDMGTAQGEELQKLLTRYEDVEHQVQAAGGYEVDHLIDATLHGVGLTDEFFGVKVADLSGGQKGRLALAKLLLSHPDVLLMDEPTNHLDIAGRQWLEEYLAEYRGAVVLVSHDRWLLDRVVSKIYEMHDGKLEDYPGNYQQFRVLRAERRLAQQREYDKQQERIKHEQGFIDRYRAGQRARQAQGREKRLERFKRDSLIDRPVEMNSIAVRMRPAQRAGDLVATADHISKAYERKVLFRDLSLVVKRGDKVGVIGPNGAGKTTLVNCLLGLMEPDDGKLRVGSSVSVGHYRQSQEHLDLALSVVEYLRQFVMGGSRAAGSEQAARDLAGAFLFSGQDQDKQLGVLSGGERSRAVLAGLVVGGHNLLVLDEPTNHLDIASAERLEAALRQFTEDQGGFGDSATGAGTLILITHDRMLLEDLVDQLLVLDGAGNVRHFQGTYSEYLAAQQKTPGAAERGGGQGSGFSSSESRVQGPESRVQSRRSKVQGPRSKVEGGREKHQGKGEGTSFSPRGHAGESSKSGRTEGKGGRDARPTKSGGLSKLNQQALEEAIVQLEARLAQIDRELAEPETYRVGGKVKQLQDQRAKVTAELRPLEEEWSRRADSEPT